ncbi:MAG: LD-carboxypeptidase [Bacteroidales bacterium]|nr:LD-carboxypeptidase [Bacteroidales bacterium]
MLKPDFLHEGDIVTIISPSGPVTKGSLDFAIETLQSWGLQVKLGKHTYDKLGVFAGSDENRASDLQKAIEDKKTKAIICARGGYGAIRIADSIDYSSLQKRPKWFVGFSDITVFHEKLHFLGIQSLHGAMAKSFPNVTPESLQSLHDSLFGTNKAIQIKSTKFNKTGECKGELIGGNLSMIYSLRGVPFEYDYTGKILFIEDLNEYYYHIDRMMQNLLHSGVLSKISGLIVGTMSGMRNGTDTFDGSVEDIVLNVTKDYNIPVVFDFPSGHEDLNQALVFGEKYELKVTKRKVSLKIIDN